MKTADTQLMDYQICMFVCQRREVKNYWQNKDKVAASPVSAVGCSSHCICGSSGSSFSDLLAGPSGCSLANKYTHIRAVQYLM